MKSNKIYNVTVLRMVLVGLVLLFSVENNMKLFAQDSTKINSIVSETRKITIFGKIENEEGSPIEGAIIQEKGKSDITTTNSRGEFSKTFLSRSITLHVSAKGYLSIEQTIKDEFILTLVLKRKNEPVEQNEIYVLFGTQKKDLTTGAYSQINGKQIETRGVVNNRNSLTGLLSGLMSMQGSGEPGNENAMQMIRGKHTISSTNPLVLVDGYERSMDLLDPNEIEAITVLKDAAATARYGLRSSNGIINVTTRRGTEGKIKVNAHIRSGLKMATTEPKLLDSYDYARLYNEAQLNDNPNATPFYSELHLQKYLNARNGIIENPNDIYLYPNINWYDEFTNKVTWQQRSNVNLSGGDNFARFYVSVGYVSNSGMYKVDPEANNYNTNANQDMITLRSNLDINVNKRFVISLDLNGRQELGTSPGASSSSSSNLFSAFYRTPPNAFPIFQKNIDTEKNWLMIGGTKNNTNNPYGMLNRSGYSLSTSRYFASTLRLKHDFDFITKGLSVKAEIAFDSEYEMTTDRSKTFRVYGIDTDANGQPNYTENDSKYYILTGNDSPMNSGGAYPSSTSKINYRLGLNYERTFGDHAIFAETQINELRITTAQSTNLPRIYRSVDARLSYNYQEKYLLDFNLGIMGSEQFLKNDRFGTFPALSIGWIISNESFLKNNPILSFLKVRSSVGLTGWDDIGGYFQWYQQFNIVPITSNVTNFGPTATAVQGSVESAFALENVTWEKNQQFNIGVDTRFFNDKLNLTFDYFYERNRDIMTEPELPYIMGSTFPNFPIGVVQNQGLDLSLGYKDKINNLQFSISGILTFAKNKVLEMGEKEKTYAYQMATGRPLDSRFGLIALGLFQSEDEIANSPIQTFASKVNPGDIKYMDVNGDGVINSFDKVYLGTNADPDIQGGVQLDMSWERFDFNILVTAQDGGGLNRSGPLTWEFDSNGNVSEQHLGRFNPRDESSWATATYPRLSLTNKSGNQQESTYWRVSVLQARLKNIELGYSIPVTWTNNVVKNIRLYVNAYNLIMWQKTDVIDVEARNGSYTLYPIQKIINFGVNVTF